MSNSTSQGQAHQTVYFLDTVLNNGQAHVPSIDENELLEYCELLLLPEGERPDEITADAVLDGYDELTNDKKRRFFHRVASEFGGDENSILDAIAGWSPRNPCATRALYLAAQPRSRQLIAALNKATNGVSRLLRMRSDLLELCDNSDLIQYLDAEFRDFTQIWVDSGTLELRRLDWAASVGTLEQIVNLGVLRDIHDWEDLRNRIGERDRRIYSVYHSALPGEPLVVIEVALTNEIPAALPPMYYPDRPRYDPETADTPVLCSISTLPTGVEDVLMSSVPIRQAIADLKRELPKLKRFVTLSPIPSLRGGVARAMVAQDDMLSPQDREKLATLGKGRRPDATTASRLAARYLTQSVSDEGMAIDPVAHFHFSNGGSLHAIHAEADLTDEGVSDSWGVMVSYLYDEVRMASRKDAFAGSIKWAVSREVLSLAAD